MRDEKIHAKKIDNSTLPAPNETKRSTHLRPISDILPVRNFSLSLPLDYNNVSNRAWRFHETNTTFSIMKVSGFLQGSGKVGEIVLAKCAGATIARAYNENVANPSTPSQVNNRAKLKLISQLSASLSPIIAMPKVGMSSSRNQFSKRNYRYLNASNGVATISYENVQLTTGNAGIPQLTVLRTAGESTTVKLAEAAGSLIDTMIYAVLRKNSEGQLQLLAEAAVHVGGQNDDYPATLDYFEGELVIYGYGIKASSAKAQANYGNMLIESAQDVARLIANRSVSTSDLIFTATRGCTLGAGETDITPVPAGQARVFVTANGQGTVTGAGTFTIGNNVTVEATPATGYTFKGWRLNGSQEYLSNQASYTFKLQQQTDLIADFAVPGSDDEDDH